MGRNHHGDLPRKTVHPRSGHARVRYNGKEIWLGKDGSPEAQQKYDQLIHEIVSSRLQLAPPSVDAPATQEQPEPKPAASDIRVKTVTLDPRIQPTAITVRNPDREHLGKQEFGRAFLCDGIAVR